MSNRSVTLDSFGPKFCQVSTKGAAVGEMIGAVVDFPAKLSTPSENLTVPPIENLTDRRGDEPQVVAAS